MPQYRVHIFDRFGRDRVSLRLEFADDQEAIDFVAAGAQGHLMDLREGERLVRRFEAEAPFGPSSGRPDSGDV